MQLLFMYDVIIIVATCVLIFRLPKDLWVRFVVCIIYFVLVCIAYFVASFFELMLPLLLLLLAVAVYCYQQKISRKI